MVETASLAAVEPPDVTYELHLDDQIEEGTLSGLQLESIVYACQRHEQRGGVSPHEACRCRRLLTRSAAQYTRKGPAHTDCGYSCLRQT